MTKYFSGDETTERESLKDLITVRAAFNTPLLRNLPQVTVNNRVVEYSIDEPFQSADNVRLVSNPHVNTRKEGADWSYGTPFFPVKLRSIAEIVHFGMEITNSDLKANVAGMESTFSYRAGQTFTKLVNQIDHILMYGVGSPETSGKTDERKTQGLINWAAWTGLERCHGSRPDMDDPYGINIPSSMYSVFFDAEHTNINSKLFFRQVIRRLLKAGADMDSAPWTFFTGAGIMQEIARFLITDGGIPINDRTVEASSGMGYDFLQAIRLPTGQVVTFRTNRWLDEDTSTFSVTNYDYTPGTPDTPGTQSRTFNADQTLIGYEPGTVRIGWYREPAFINVPTDGDYRRVAAVAEFMLQVDHPLCVAGLGNALA